MWYRRKQYQEKAAELAKELHVSTRSVINSGIMKPMSEHARQTLIARLKKVHEPHGEPMLIGPGVAVQETAETITITIRKLPQSERLAAVPETADLLAVRRAAGGV